MATIYGRAVLLAHEGAGLDDYQKGRAERLADLGYIAFALDQALPQPSREQARAVRKRGLPA